MVLPLPAAQRRFMALGRRNSSPPLTGLRSRSPKCPCVAQELRHSHVPQLRHPLHPWPGFLCHYLRELVLGGVFLLNLVLQGHVDLVLELLHLLGLGQPRAVFERQRTESPRGQSHPRVSPRHRAVAPGSFNPSCSPGWFWGLPTLPTPLWVTRFLLPPRRFDRCVLRIFRCIFFPQISFLRNNRNHPPRKQR